MEGNTGVVTNINNNNNKERRESSPVTRLLGSGRAGSGGRLDDASWIQTRESRSREPGLLQSLQRDKLTPKRLSTGSDDSGWIKSTSSSTTRRSTGSDDPWLRSPQRIRHATTDSWSSSGSGAGAAGPAAAAASESGSGAARSSAIGASSGTATSVVNRWNASILEPGKLRIKAEDAKSWIKSDSKDTRLGSGRLQHNPEPLRAIHTPDLTLRTSDPQPVREAKLRPSDIGDVKLRLQSFEQGLMQSDSAVRTRERSRDRDRSRDREFRTKDETIISRTDILKSAIAKFDKASNGHKNTNNPETDENANRKYERRLRTVRTRRKREEEVCEDVKDGVKVAEGENQGQTDTSRDDQDAISRQDVTVITGGNQGDPNNRESENMSVPHERSNPTAMTQPQDEGVVRPLEVTSRIGRRRHDPPAERVERMPIKGGPIQGQDSTGIDADSRVNRQEAALTVTDSSTVTHQDTAVKGADSVIVTDSMSTIEDTERAPTPRHSNVTSNQHKDTIQAGSDVQITHKEDHVDNTDSGCVPIEQTYTAQGSITLSSISPAVPHTDTVTLRGREADKGAILCSNGGVQDEGLEHSVVQSMVQETRQGEGVVDGTGVHVQHDTTIVDTQIHTTTPTLQTGTTHGEGHTDTQIHTVTTTPTLQTGTTHGEGHTDTQIHTVTTTPTLQTGTTHGEGHTDTQIHTVTTTPTLQTGTTHGEGHTDQEDRSCTPQLITRDVEVIDKKTEDDTREATPDMVQLKEEVDTGGEGRTESDVSQGHRGQVNVTEVSCISHHTDSTRGEDEVQAGGAHSHTTLTHVMENTAADVTENTLTDVTENTATDVIENTVTDVIENTVTDVIENTLTDVTENTLTDVIENTATDVTEHTVTDVIENTATDVTEHTVTDVTENTATDVTENTVTDVTENTVTDVTENTVTNDIENSVTNDLVNIPEIQEDTVQASTADLTLHTPILDVTDTDRHIEDGSGVIDTDSKVDKDSGVTVSHIEESVSHTGPVSTGTSETQDTIHDTSTDTSSYIDTSTDTHIATHSTHPTDTQSQCVQGGGGSHGDQSITMCHDNNNGDTELLLNMNDDRSGVPPVSGDQNVSMSSTVTEDVVYVTDDDSYTTDSMEQCHTTVTVSQKDVPVKNLHDNRKGGHSVNTGLEDVSHVEVSEGSIQTEVGEKEVELQPEENITSKSEVSISDPAEESLQDVDPEDERPYVYDNDCTDYNDEIMEVDETGTLHPHVPQGGDSPSGECDTTPDSARSTDTLPESAGTSNESAGTSNESAGTSNESAGTSNESAGTSNESAGTSNESVDTSNGSVGTSNESAGTSNESVGTSNESAGTSNESAGTSNESAGTSNESAGTSNESAGTSNESAGTSNESAGTSNESVGTSNEPLGTTDTVVTTGAIQLKYDGKHEVESAVKIIVTQVKDIRGESESQDCAGECSEEAPGVVSVRETVIGDNDGENNELDMDTITQTVSGTEVVDESQSSHFTLPNTEVAHGSEPTDSALPNTEGMDGSEPLGSPIPYTEGVYRTGPPGTTGIMNLAQADLDMTSMGEYSNQTESKVSERLHNEPNAEYRGAHYVGEDTRDNTIRAEGEGTGQETSESTQAEHIIQVSAHEPSIETSHQSTAIDMSVGDLTVRAGQDGDLAGFTDDDKGELNCVYEDYVLVDTPPTLSDTDDTPCDTPREHQTTPREHQTAPGENQMIHEDHQTAPGDHQMIHGDHQMIHGDHQMIHGDHQMIHEDHQMIHGDHQMIHGDHQMIHGDHQMIHGDHQMIHGDHQMIHGDHQMIHGDHQMIHGDHQIAQSSKTSLGWFGRHDEMEEVGFDVNEDDARCTGQEPGAVSVGDGLATSPHRDTQTDIEVHTEYGTQSDMTCYQDHTQSNHCNTGIHTHPEQPVGDHMDDRMDEHLVQDYTDDDQAVLSQGYTRLTDDDDEDNTITQVMYMDEVEIPSDGDSNGEYTDNDTEEEMLDSEEDEEAEGSGGRLEYPWGVVERPWGLETIQERPEGFDSEHEEEKRAPLAQMESSDDDEEWIEEYTFIHHETEDNEPDDNEVEDNEAEEVQSEGSEGHEGEEVPLITSDVEPQVGTDRDVVDDILCEGSDSSDKMEYMDEAPHEGFINQDDIHVHRHHDHPHTTSSGHTEPQPLEEGLILQHHPHTTSSGHTEPQPLEEGLIQQHHPHTTSSGHTEPQPLEEGLILQHHPHTTSSDHTGPQPLEEGLILQHNDSHDVVPQIDKSLTSHPQTTPDSKTHTKSTVEGYVQGEEGDCDAVDGSVSSVQNEYIIKGTESSESEAMLSEPVSVYITQVDEDCNNNQTSARIAQCDSEGVTEVAEVRSDSEGVTEVAEVMSLAVLSEAILALHTPTEDTTKAADVEQSVISTEVQADLTSGQDDTEVQADLSSGQDDTEVQADLSSGQDDTEVQDGSPSGHDEHIHKLSEESLTAIAEAISSSAVSEAILSVLKEEPMPEETVSEGIKETELSINAAKSAEIDEASLGGIWENSGRMDDVPEESVSDVIISEASISLQSCPVVKDTLSGDDVTSAPHSDSDMSAMSDSDGCEEDSQRPATVDDATLDVIAEYMSTEVMSEVLVSLQSQLDQLNDEQSEGSDRIEMGDVVHDESSLHGSTGDTTGQTAEVSCSGTMDVAVEEGAVDIAGEGRVDVEVVEDMAEGMSQDVITGTMATLQQTETMATLQQTETMATLQQTETMATLQQTETMATLQQTETMATLQQTLTEGPSKNSKDDTNITETILDDKLTNESESATSHTLHVEIQGPEFESLGPDEVITESVDICAVETEQEAASLEQTAEAVELSERVTVSKTAEVTSVIDEPRTDENAEHVNEQVTEIGETDLNDAIVPCSETESRNDNETSAVLSVDSVTMTTVEDMSEGQTKDSVQSMSDVCPSKPDAGSNDGTTRGIVINTDNTLKQTVHGENLQTDLGLTTQLEHTEVQSETSVVSEVKSKTGTKVPPRVREECASTTRRVHRDVKVEPELSTQERTQLLRETRSRLSPTVTRREQDKAVSEARYRRPRRPPPTEEELEMKRLVTWLCTSPLRTGDAKRTKMLNGDEDVCYDSLILEVFEESETIFFPIVQQKEARAFVKALHMKGVTYEALCQEVGEHEHNFTSWRKSLGRAGIGHAVMQWANRPLQDLLDDEEEVDEDDGMDDADVQAEEERKVQEERLREEEGQRRLQGTPHTDKVNKDVDHNKNDQKDAHDENNRAKTNGVTMRRPKEPSPPPTQTKAANDGVPPRQKYEQEPDLIRLKRLEEFKRTQEKGDADPVQDIRKRISLFEKQQSPSKSGSESREESESGEVEEESRTETESISSGSMDEPTESSPEPPSEPRPKSPEPPVVIEEVISVQQEAVVEDVPHGATTNGRSSREATPKDTTTPPSTTDDNKPRDQTDSGSNLPDVNENYNSDLDPDNEMHSPVQAIAAKKIASSRVNKTWSGFIFVFSDTPANSETCRVKVGASAFPHKRLRQAQLFNPNMYQVHTVAVKQRSAALEQVLAELDPYRLSGQKDWFEGPFNDLLAAISDVAARFPSSRKIIDNSADDEDSESAC